MTDTVRVEVTPEDDGWVVAYRAPDGGEVAPSRRLRRTGAPPWSFPRPPAGEVEGIEAGAPHRELCTAADETPLVDALAELTARTPGSRAVETVGRYLFATLLGDAWGRVARQPLRLELSWPVTDAAFGRFPWELLHDGTGFVALRDGVTVLRRVAGPAVELAPATAPLDVLFVVGRGLRDDLIRPAAEYLGLVQNLRALDLERRLRPRLLLEATTETLEASLAERRPAVVHVMTHGRYRAARPYLELRSTSGPGVEEIFAPNLLELLKSGGGPLPVVVLSACETAVARERARGGESAAPFAAELVAGGVPLVVGMTGPVGDLACRLFARAFYSALLSGADAAAAAAAGRRAAVQHGGYDPRSSYDWALPTLVLSSALATPRLAVTDAPFAAERQRLARELQPGRYPVFCDRLPIFAAGETLLADAAVQRRLRRGGERQVLALSTAEDAGAVDGGELYGRTWALRALAARATLAGHLPCLVSADYLTPGGDPPAEWGAFVDLLRLSMEQTAVELGVDHRPCEVSGFLLGGERPAEMPGELGHLAEPPAEPEPLDLARALRHDLLGLLEAVRAGLPEAERPRCRLLLLIDDLHRMGDVAAELLDYGLGAFGLRRCRHDVRVAFTWARRGRPYQSTIQRIVDWLGDSPADDLSLDRFQDLEELLAYQHFLFHYHHRGSRKPLAVALETPENKPFIDHFFTKLRERVDGVPSRLAQAEEVVDVFLTMPPPANVLVPARDEDVIELWRQAGGQLP